MKCDLHIHTCYSYDSSSSPKEIVRTAIKKGIDCIAITDHEEVKGAEIAARFAENKPILVIPGIEIKSKQGDILGLNVREIIPNGLSAEETVKKIKKAGGKAFIPHPFAFPYPFKGNLKKFKGLINGIEVLNATIFGPGNKKALAFAQKYNLPMTAGSDAHSPEFVGKAYLEIVGENLSLKEIFQAIQERKVKIGGKEASFLEKIIDHIRRNSIHFKNYAFGKKRKI
jgi:predicted metal-dependent phosphoesterase TrpH